MRTLHVLPVLVLLASSGCSNAPDGATSSTGSTSAGSTGSGGAACPAPTGGARALDLGGPCVSLATARVRSGGTWRELPVADVTVGPAGSGALTLSMHAPAPVEAFELVLRAPKAIAMLQQGYQSWGFSGAIRIPSSVPLDDTALAARAASTGDPLDEVEGVSYGAAVVGDPGGPALTLGTTSAAVATTAIGATASPDGTTLSIVYGAAREPLPADAGGDVAMPPVFVAATSDAQAGLAMLGDRLAAALPAPVRTPLRPPGGWFSWNELFAGVDEPAVAANVALAQSELLPVGMPLVEIDDGWEVAWGDWQANAKFPSSMDGTGASVAAAGLVPGVWLAPFLVDTTSSVAQTADPASFVHDAKGGLLVHTPSGQSKTYYVLDGTNDAAMAIAGAPIAQLAAAGFRFFKLDFLYAAALPGVRSDPAATGVEALRRGLATLRTAMGDTAIFNACGAPILPVLGLADSLRIGSDTAFSGALLNWTNVAFAARSASARSFLAPMVWLDADQTQVRAPYTTDEAKASAFAAALAGPAYSLGDDLRTLPADRLAIALDPTVLDLAGADAPAVADDPLESPADAVVVSPIFDALEHPGSTGAPPPTTFRMRGKSGTAYVLTFAWTSKHRVTVSP